MAKRPQQRTNSLGVPNIAPDVVASPVEITEIVGNEGMPAAPNAIAKPPTGPDRPAPVNTQSVRDAEREANAYLGLSSSLRRTALAKEEYNDMLEVEGAQLADYIDWSNKEALTFTRALSDGEIRAMDHPRFSAALAEQAANNRVRLIKKVFEEERSRLRVGDEALNIEAYERVLGSLYDNEKFTFKGARQEVYRGALDAAFKSAKEFELAVDSAWISDQGTEASKTNVMDATLEILENSYNRERNTSVEFTAFPEGHFLNSRGIQQTTKIFSETDEEHFASRVGFAAEQYSMFLDAHRGGLLSSTNMNKIIGRQLIDLAANSSKYSAFAEAVLKEIQTGPKDSRTNLLSGEVKREYELNRDRIKSRQTTANTQTANRMFQAQVDQVKGDLVNRAVAAMESNPNVTPESIQYNILETLLGDQRVAPYDGYTVSAEGGNNLVLTPDGSTGATTPRTISLSELKKEIVELRLRRETEDNIKSEVVDSELQAAAHASNTVGEVHPVVQAGLSRVVSQTSQYRQMTDREFAEEDIAAAREAYGSYLVLKENPVVLNKTLNKEELEFYDLLDSLMTNPRFDFYGGSISKSLETLSRPSTDISGLWDSDKVGESIDKLTAVYADRNSAVEYIRDTAAAMMKVGMHQSSDAAVADAHKSYMLKTIELPDGIRVDRADFPIANIQSTFDIQEFQKGDWSYLSRVTGAKLETGQQMLMATPEIFNELWDAFRSSDLDATEALMPVMLDVMQKTRYNLQDKHTDVGVFQVLEGAAASLERNPPDNFAAENLTVFRSDEGDLDLYFVPISGTKGLFYQLYGRTANNAVIPLTNPDNSGRPFTIAQIAQIYGESRRDMVETEPGVFKEDPEFDARRRRFVGHPYAPGAATIGNFLIDRLMGRD